MACPVGPSSSCRTRTPPTSRNTRRSGSPPGIPATRTSRRPATAIRCKWREERADRLEALVLDDLFAADRIADAAEREAAKAAAFKALGTLLRYRARMEREHRQAMAALETLRQRRPTRPTERTRDEATPSAQTPTTAVAPMAGSAARPGEPEPGNTAVPTRAVPREPEPRTLNRHQRRTLAAIERKALRWAA